MASTKTAVPVSRETIDWLLSDENPPVRYLTLTRLLDRSLRSAEVRQTERRLGEYGPTRKILADRKRFWAGHASPAQLYQKYRGGYWQLIFLGEYLAPRDLPGIEEGVERLLHPDTQFMSGHPWFGIHCLNANVFRAMVALGFGADARVRQGLDHLAREVVDAKGVPCFIIDWSIYPTCRMTVPKVLLALTALPAKERTPVMAKAARICRDQLLEHEVSRYVSPLRGAFARHVADLPPGAPRGISTKPEKRREIQEIKRAFIAGQGGLGDLTDKPGWLRFGFPLHYNSDALEAMVALAQADCPARTPKVAHAVDVILARRRPDGRWNMDVTLNGKMIADVETKGRPSRWITYRALFALKHFRGLAIA